MKIRRNLVVAGLVSFLSVCSTASLLAAPTVTNLTLVSEKRVGRTTFEYTYKATFQNDNTNWMNLKAALTGVGAGTKIIEGNVIVGPLSPNQTIVPDDTITLLQERTSFFDRNALIWTYIEVPIPSGTQVLLPGNEDDLAHTALYDLTTKKGVQESDIATDADGQRYPLTRIVLELEPTATVGQVNADLQGVSGSIISMLSDHPFVVVEIPNPGSLAALDGILITLKASPAILDASKEGFLAPSSLPPAIPSSGGGGALMPIKHHLAIRGHAAWNVIDSFRDAMNPPGVVVGDFWGGGAPSANQGFNVDVLQLDDFEIGISPDIHGYHVLGIMGAAFDDTGTAATVPVTGLAGMLSGGFRLRAVDLTKTTKVVALQNIAKFAKTLGNRVVINTSVGYECDANTQSALSDANKFIASIDSAKLHDKALIVAAAGNIDSDNSDGKNCFFSPPVDVSSPFTAAALNTNIVSTKNVSVPNLKNVLVVQNVIADGRPFITTGPDLAPICTNGGDANINRLNHLASITGTLPNSSLVSGVGTNVFSFNVPGKDPVFDTGTSMASPQVAALAIWLWSLNKDLSVAQLKKIITDTANSPAVNASANSSTWLCDPAPMAPVVDAYRATMALDVKENGKFRMALFDVARKSDHRAVAPPLVLPDKEFEQADLRLWVKELLSRKGASFDYSRFDLNGDGRTGELKSAMGFGGRSFDLNADRDLSNSVSRTIEGVEVKFDETNLSDAEILCYYAYSPLYTGAQDALGILERTVLMIPILDQCGVALSSVKVNIGGSADGYPLPMDTTLGGLGTPIQNNFFWNGTGTCGGEQGGPVWSSYVTPGSYFVPVTEVTDPPVPANIFPNRRPCSSFFAVNDGKIWFNATGRRWQTSGFNIIDREYQARYFSDPQYGVAADPSTGREATREMNLGWANVPYGNFVQTNLLTESSNTVSSWSFTFVAK